MVNLDKRYTAGQVAIAARELRDAAGTDEAKADEAASNSDKGAGETYFSGYQAVSMLSEEIRLLHERGFSDERIADFFQGFDIDIDPKDIAAASSEGLG